MRIAFLGWGSLIWNPRNLRISEEWHTDGPFLPVEFARISNDKRLTLVLYPSADKVQVLWTHANVHTLDEAIESLKQREDAPENRIGFLSTTENKSHCQVVPEVLDEIRSWAQGKNLDAVVWTDLPSNFAKESGRELNESNAVEYLSGLQGKERQAARQYIEKAPPQIMTGLRRNIEQELRWKHEGNNR